MIDKRTTDRYATCASPIKQLICPLKFCISIVFNFSWDGCNTQAKWKTKVFQNFVLQIRCIMGDGLVAYNTICSMKRPLWCSGQNNKEVWFQVSVRARGPTLAIGCVATDTRKQFSLK